MLSRDDILKVGRIIWRGIVQIPGEDARWVEIDLTHTLLTEDKDTLATVMAISIAERRMHSVDGPPIYGHEKCLRIE